MKITAVQAFPIKIPRDLTDARGTAGSPAPLAAGKVKSSAEVKVSKFESAT